MTNNSFFRMAIGAATARVARVRTLPTFGILTWDPQKFCSKVLIHYTMDPTIFSTPAAPLRMAPQSRLQHRSGIWESRSTRISGWTSRSRCVVDRATTTCVASDKCDTFWTHRHFVHSWWPSSLAGSTTATVCTPAVRRLFCRDFNECRAQLQCC